MTLRDELTTQPMPQCRVAALLTKLEAGLSTELQELLDDPSVQSSALARLAKTKDWDVSEYSFQRHRRKSCKCR